MLNRPVRGRRHESGQALAIALAFIAFFGVVTTAVLDYAGATARQQANTEAAALRDSTAEGGALFAAADAGRGGSACMENTVGSLTMQGGDSVGYTVEGCTEGRGAAATCVLCLLDQSGALQMSRGGEVVVDGAVDINGAGSVGDGTVTSAGAQAFVGCAGTCQPGGFSPAPSVIGGVVDPLARLVPPVVSTPRTQGSATTLDPGVYDTISVGDADDQIVLNPGIYVITRSLSATAGARITGSGVLLYFACRRYPTPCRSTGESGATLTSSDALVAITPPASGPYAGVGVYYDPHNTGVVDIDNGALMVDGTVYARSAAVGVHNLSNNDSNGGQSRDGRQDGVRGGNGVDVENTINGRLIAGSLTTDFFGTMALPGTQAGPPCTSIYDATVSGASGTSSVAAGHVVVATECNGGTGVIGFDYAP